MTTTGDNNKARLLCLVGTIYCIPSRKQTNALETLVDTLVLFLPRARLRQMPMSNQHTPSGPETRAQHFNAQRVQISCVLPPICSQPWIKKGDPHSWGDRGVREKNEKSIFFILILAPRFSFSLSPILPSIPFPLIRLRIDSSLCHETTAVMENTNLGLVRASNTFRHPVADVRGSRGM